MAVLCALSGCGSSHHTAFVTNPVTGSVASYRVDDQTGAFSQIPGSPYLAGISPTAIVMHPNGKWAYVTNGGGPDISFFKISSVFSLTEVMPRTPTGDNPASLAIDPPGKFIYVASANKNFVTAYAIDASAGTLSQVGTPVAAGYNPIFVTISPSGKYLYVANSAGGTVSGFALDGAGGLTQVPGSPYNLNFNGQVSGPSWLAIDSQERFLFVANQLANNVAGFTINSTTGALTSIPGQPFVVGINPTSLTFATIQSGTYLYVCNLKSSNVTALTVNNQGVATQVSGSPYAAGQSPNVIELDPNGQFLYVSSHDNRQILSFVINQLTGQIAQKSKSGLGDTPSSLLVLK
jgi:6-phosphogluconolactonase (cycloisomerase 2 family)